MAQIQCAGRFVEDKQPRLAHEPLPEQDQLLLTARQRVDPAIGKMLQSQLAKHRQGSRDLRFAYSPSQLLMAGEQKGLQHREICVYRAMLRHEADSSAVDWAALP